MHKLYKNYKNYTRIIVTELQDIDIELIYYNQVEHKIEEHWWQNLKFWALVYSCLMWSYIRITIGWGIVSLNIERINLMELALVI